jgi:aspartate-semialdehyde dehydrogenase
MSTGNLRIAIIGGTTLKGKELADVLHERNFPSRDVRLLEDDESLGQLEAVGDEVTFVQSITSEQLENVDVVFFASDEFFTRRHWPLVRSAGAAVVDLSYGLEDEKGALVRAPWIARELGRPLSFDLQPAPAVVAHPAALVLALLLLRVQKAGRMRTAAATIIEPASEHGRRGMDELHEQTVSLLSFRELPKQVFDSQVAFNLIARYGEKSLFPLAAIEHRIIRHFEQITSGLVPVPAVLLLQGPSFHGHAFALYMEFELAVTLEVLVSLLRGEHIVLADQPDDAPSNVNTAGRDEILVAARRDARNPNGFWLWATADNLRLITLNALECAESLAAALPKGKVQ